MDINDIYGIIDKFDASGCSELNLEMNGISLGLIKSNSGVLYENTAQEKTAFIQRDLKQEEPVGKMQNLKSQTSDAVKEVKAPLVGTFYTAAGPHEKPFVKIGQNIHAGDVIGIIEAMKLMNEVTADCDGVVKEIAAENGTMVEYGQPLIILN